MAASYQQLWEEQKKKNPYLTLSNASTAAKTSAGTTAGTDAVQTSVQSAVKSTKSSGSKAKSLYQSMMGSSVKPNTTTTLQDAKTVPTGTDRVTGESILTDEYRKQLAEKAAQANAAAQTVVQEETTTEETGGGNYIPPAVPTNQGLQTEEEDPFEEKVDPLEEYLDRILAAQNAQYQSLIDAIKGQSGALNAQYDANAANLYELYRRGQLAFPELMSGTATGIADSFALENNLNFQNNLNDNELARAAALQALQTQANQYQADAELQAAQTAADWAQMMYQRQASQSKGSGSSSGSSNGSTSTNVETEPVAMLSSSEALLAARQAGTSYTEQLAFLQQLYYSGQITPEQYSDLKMALDPTLSYK